MRTVKKHLLMKEVQEEIKELGKLPNGNIRNNYLVLDLMEVD